MEVFCEKGVLKSFAKFSGKHLCQSSAIFKVSFANFEHVFVRWESYLMKVVVVRNLQITYQANKYLLKVSKRNPKTSCEGC